MPGSDEALLHYMSILSYQVFKKHLFSKIIKSKKLLGVFQKYDIINKIRG